MSAYYYAAGHKIELEGDDEYVAVDQKAAQQAGLDINVAAVGGAMPRQGAGVLLAPRSALGKQTLANLRKAGALQPVYRREQAVIVPLPEVRIEFDNAAQRRAVKKVLAEIPAEHTIAEDTKDMIVVRPASGNGDAALQIANDVYERAHPAAASVRFLQFVPKPHIVRRAG